MKQALSTEHSMVEASVQGRALDLLSHPWELAQEQWMHPSDYTETQKLATLVRNSQTEVRWIRYASVRASDHVCAAVFDPRSLTMVTPEGRYEQWHCYTTVDKVTLSNGRVASTAKSSSATPLWASTSICLCAKTNWPQAKRPPSLTTAAWSTNHTRAASR
jgi:hypothetical protein